MPFKLFGGSHIYLQGFIIQDFLLGGGGGTIETFTHRGCQACITEIMTSEIQIEHKLATCNWTYLNNQTGESYFKIFH